MRKILALRRHNARKEVKCGKLAFPVVPACSVNPKEKTLRIR